MDALPALPLPLLPAAARSPDRPPRRRLLQHLHFSSGRHYWEALVERLDDQDGMVVGVVATFERSARSGSGGFKGPEGEGSVGYCSTGEILSDGACVGRAGPFQRGDIVGVLVDINCLGVGFYLNDQPQTHIPVDSATDTAEELTVGAEDREGRSRVRLSLCCRAVVAAVSLPPGTDEVVAIASEPQTERTGGSR